MRPPYFETNASTENEGVISMPIRPEWANSADCVFDVCLTSDWELVRLDVLDQLANQSEMPLPGSG
jgi:hypothetical protein